MEHPELSVHPTVQKDTGLKVKVPSTPEGRQFLADLQRLLKVETLPFEKLCSGARADIAAQADADTTPHAEADRANPSSASGSTTYVLDLRVEQEGWAP